MQYCTKREESTYSKGDMGLSQVTWGLLVVSNTIPPIFLFVSLIEEWYGLLNMQVKYQLEDAITQELGTNLRMQYIQ